MHRDRADYSKDALDTLGDRTTYVTLFVLGLIAVVGSLELDDPAVFAIGLICVVLPVTFVSGLARHAWNKRRYKPPNTRRT